MKVPKNSPFSPHIDIDLGLRYSSTSKYSEHILFQVVMVKRLTQLVHKTFRTLKSKLLVYEPHVGPILDCRSTVCSNMHKSGRLDIAKVKRRYPERILCYRPAPNHIKRCEKLHLDSLQLCEV